MNMDSSQGSLRLNEGILILDDKNKVAYINSTMSRMLGAGAKAAGKSFAELDRQPWGEGLLAGLAAEARKSGAEITREITWKAGGDTRHSRLRAFVNQDRAHIVAEDVTQSKAMEIGLTRFVGPSLVDQLKSNGLSSWKAERTVMTVLGATPADFSFHAERLEPHVLRDFLSDFVRRAVDVAKSTGASVVKLAVPSILLGWAGEGHAKRAVEAARLLAAAGRELERSAALQGMGGVKLKIALNTGAVVVGPVGSPERMEYTLLGNHVDIVTRLVDGALAGTTMLTKAVADELKGWKPEKCRLLDHGPQRIWGIDHPVGVMMLVDE